jgi:predicted metal-dependent peptidase
MSDLSDPIRAEIVKARVKMLFDKPFFGTLATRLELVEADGWCKTAATDGRRLYYNREFIKSLDIKGGELFFLLCHEVLHCVYNHLGRRNGRDPKLWNMANDYIVNYTLVDEKCGKMPAQGLYDKRFTDEMTSEEVYDILKKNSVTIKMPLDEHLELGDDNSDNDGQGSGNGKDVEVTVMGKDGPPKLTEEDLQRIRADIKAATIQAAQAVGAGRVPAGIRRMIEELINPKMDWRSLLDAHIRSSVKDDYTFQKSSRRTMALHAGGFNAPILPAQDYMNTIKIAAVIDASGSTTDEMQRDFLSEIKGIMDTFRDFELHVFSFDTEIYNPKTFTPENIDEIYEYPVAGGGGTLFECVFEYLKREGLEPDRLVMFTDGYPNSTWGDPNYCDTLFVIHGSTSIIAPYGMTAYYDTKKPS